MTDPPLSKAEIEIEADAYVAARKTFDKAKLKISKERKAAGLPDLSKEEQDDIAHASGLAAYETVKRVLEAGGKPLSEDSAPPDWGGPPIGENEPPLTLTPTPFTPRDPATFPRRQFLYANHYARKYVSTTIAAGDTGKTALALAEAISMAVNKALLGVSVKRPLRVWYWNGEDPREEIERRVLAICVYHKIDQSLLVGHLFLDSGRETKLIVAEMNGRGLKIAVPVKEALIKALIDHQIDVLIVDPFVKTHRVSENDNTLMDAVAGLFADVAEAAYCSVELVQHTRKLSGADATGEDARGASSVVAAARMGRTLNRMNKQTGETVGVAEADCRYHIRLDPEAKSNMLPPQKATWVKLVSAGLGNFAEGEDEDHVQVAVAWDWPNPFEGVSVEHLRAVQRRVRENPRRKDVRSADWIGYLIIDELRLDRDNKAAREKAKTIFDLWLKNRMFKIVVRDDEKRREREYVEVGEWASD